MLESQSNSTSVYNGIASAGDAIMIVISVYQFKHRFGTSAIVQGLKEAGDDNTVGTVVLRIDSGGGGVIESDTIWGAVRDLRSKGKVVIASFGNAAASGGYLIATHADSIFAMRELWGGGTAIFMDVVVMANNFFISLWVAQRYTATSFNYHGLDWRSLA